MYMCVHVCVHVCRPGSHEHEVSRNRKVEFEESFGGPKQLKKTITTKCTLGIPDKVNNTH